MNQVTREQKDNVMKVLAIFGFLAVIVFGVWLAVQIVSLMPQAFTSLASIADGVYNYREVTELVVETEKSTVNAGESLSVSWEPLTAPGVYAFSYTCTEGVSVSLTDSQGNIVNVICDETVLLGESVNGVDVTVESERQHFSDINYTISFIPEDAAGEEVVSQNMLSVINASIPDGDVVANDDTTDEVVEPEPEPEVAGDTTVEPEPTVPVVTPPTVIETVVFETPVSDPLGHTDLAVTLLAVGHLNNSGDFTQRANIDEDARGAFQFEVKNIGTKTSSEWEFEAILTSGTEYDAPKQSPLKPQERVVFTLGYDNVGEDGISMIGVTIRGGNDSNATNNSFTWAVSVVE